MSFRGLLPFLPPVNGRQVRQIILLLLIYLNFSEQEAAMLEALKLKIGADCYDYSVAKLAEMEKQSESSSDADLCENKFVINMSSVRFKNLFENIRLICMLHTICSKLYAVYSLLQIVCNYYYIVICRFIVNK